MTKILDGKALAATIRQEVATQVAELLTNSARPPGLAVVLVGEDPASEIYVRNKTKACEEIGMHGRTVHLDASTPQEDLLSVIDDLNADPAVDGMLVQLPLPSQIGVEEVQARIRPDKDVDGLHPQNVGKLWLGRKSFVPATPSGILELLDRNGIELQGKNAVIVGRSDIVGKPIAALLLHRHCTVTLCHSRTVDIEEHCRRADLLVAAVGKTAFIGPQHVKEGAVVIDVGINRVSDPDEVERLFPGNEKRQRTWEKRGSVVVGDVDYTAVAPLASAITPVPGGIGPLTVALLLANTLEARRTHDE